VVRRLLLVAGVALTLTATVVGAGLAGPSAALAGPGNAPQIKIDLECDSTPEIIKLTNRGSKDITIESVGSLLDRDNSEPYNVNETLKPGQSLKLESGEDARGGNRLTGQELFDDESNRDGAKVNTSNGTFKERC